MQPKQLRPGEYDNLPLFKPCDPSVTPEEAPLLSKQCADILVLLQQGPTTNREMVQISLKYTSRISDLRAAGYKIEVKERDHSTGMTTYELVQP